MITHFTDDTIQDYLDGNLSITERREAERHLRDCHACRELMAQYQDVFGALSHEPEFELSKNFTRTVLRKTHKQAMGEVQFNLMQIFFAVAGLIVAINALLYFGETNVLVASAKESGQAVVSFIPRLGSIFAHWLESTQFEGSIWVFSALVLLVLFLIDRFVLQRKLSTSS